LAVNKSVEDNKGDESAVNGFVEVEEIIAEKDAHKNSYAHYPETDAIQQVIALSMV